MDQVQLQLQRQANQDLAYILKEWLDVPDPSSNHRSALEKRHPKTGLWLVDGSDFNEWNSSECSLMWLHGNAGCGKTILCSTALQDILYRNESRRDTTTAYFYFDFNDLEKQSSRKAIRSLLLQFAIHTPDGLHSLEQIYRKYKHSQQQPPDEVIYSLMVELMGRITYKYIVVDALDECNDRDHFLRFVSKLTNERLQGVRVMLVSRRELDIEEELRPKADYCINIESSVVDDDIRIYVQHLLATDSKLNACPKSVQDEISTVIMKKANGMFQWVHCQIGSIRKCVKLSKLRTALSSLPTTLDETYKQILQKLESDDQLSDTIIALRWLCYSHRPLRLGELAEVLAIEEDGFSPEERLRKPTDILVVCSSLVSCNNLDDKDYIRLSHFSVKEYLLSDRCHFRSQLAAEGCHRQISKDCLQYLQYVTTQAPFTEEAEDQYPLANYSSMLWWQHAQNFEVTKGSTVFDLAWKLLMDEVALLSWQQLNNLDNPWRDTDLSLTTDDIAKPLYYAASVNIVALVEEILLQKVDIDAKGGRYGTALEAASWRGHEEIVKLLLSSGADVNAQGGEFNYALQAASSKGHERIVQMLLEAGAKVNAPGGAYGTALFEAAIEGHEKIVQMLLEAGADVSIQGTPREYHANALQGAAYGGFKNVVEMLLKAGADVNTPGGYHGNALQAAAEKNEVEVIQVLLKAGANVNARGGYYGSAFEAASFHGGVQAAQLLMDAGADYKGRRGPDALQEALLEGNKKWKQEYGVE